MFFYFKYKFRGVGLRDSIECIFKEGMFFEAEVNGHIIGMDASAEFGGKDLGPRPNPLMLVALSSCTGMDLVSLLNKMRVPFTGLQIKVDGELTDEHPKYYNNVHVIYEIAGGEESKRSIEQAVKLSQERYCAVIAVFKKAAQVTYEINYI